MSTSKKLGLLLLVLITVPFLGWAWGFLTQLKLGPVAPITQGVKTQKVEVTQEESAVISAVEKTSPSVVSVIQKSVVFDLFSGPRLAESSIGTGFAVDKNIIVTNKHVVADTSAEYTVVADISKQNQKGKKYAVIKIYRDPLNDLALLKIEGTDLPPVKLGDSDKIKAGQTVIAIGNALGRFSNTVTKGVVSGIGRGINAQSGSSGRSEYLEDVIQTDAALNPGNSGGPLLNLADEVIGINVAMGQGAQNIGFAIPVNRIKNLIQNFRENKKIARPFLGIEYQMVTQDIAQLRGLAEGAFVRSVVSGSAAKKAGIKRNDIITQIDGQKINEKTPLAKRILKYQVGDQVKLKIWRNGKTLEVTATLQEAPES